MLRLPLTALSIVCLILLSFWSIWRSTMAPFFTQPPLPSPTVTVLAISTPAPPTPTVTPIPLSAVTGTATMPPFALVLPADWQYVTLPHEEARRQWQVAQLQAGAARSSLFDGQLPKAMSMVVAWPTTAETQIGLIAYRAPRQDLTLAHYVADSAAALRAQSGVTVHQAEVNYSLVGDVPVALIHYTLPAGPHGPASDGYQVLLFDQSGEQLLLLTFTEPHTAESATQAKAAETASPLPALFQSIVRGVKRQHNDR